MTEILFLSIAFAGLAALATVLIVIGRAAADCPQIGGAARVVTLVVTTGFAAIGAGVILIAASMLPLLALGRATGLYIALGLVGIALGIGFYNAAGMLRDALQAAPKPAAATA